MFLRPNILRISFSSLVNIKTILRALEFLLCKHAAQLSFPPHGEFQVPLQVDFVQQLRRIPRASSAALCSLPANSGSGAVFPQVH